MPHPVHEVAVTEFMDLPETRSYVRLLAERKASTIFEDFAVKGQGQGLVNWSSRTRTFPEDNNTGYSVNKIIIIKLDLMIIVDAKTASSHSKLEN